MSQNTVLPKILLVSSVFPPEIGGPSGQTYHLARLLAERGYKVAVATLQSKPELIPGVFIHPLGLPNSRQLYKQMNVIERYLKIIIQLRQLVKEFQPGVIHCQTGINPLSIITGIVARQFQIPSLVKFAGDPVWERYGKPLGGVNYEHLLLHSHKIQVQLFKRMAALGFLLYDQIWSTSEYQTWVLKNGYQISQTKIFQCPNLSYIEPFRIQASKRARRAVEHRPVVLVVSRFVPWKRIDDSIRTFALANQSVRCRMRVVGGGSDAELARLHNLADELGLVVGEDIVFEGTISPTKIAHAYQDADVFLSNTIYEPFGIVFVEALASGLSVVAPAVGGVPQILNEVPNGYIFTKGNVAEAASCVVHAISDIGQSWEKTENQLQQFDLESNLVQLTEIYSRLISG